METIIITLNPDLLENPDLDLRYEVPTRIEEVTGGAVQEEGYDYLSVPSGGPLIGIWLSADSAAKRCREIWSLFRQERFLDNDLSQSAEIYISEQEGAEFEDCTRVQPY